MRGAVTGHLQSNQDLKKKLSETHKYKEQYLKVLEEDDELKGYNSEQLTTVKKMVSRLSTVHGYSSYPHVVNTDSWKLTHEYCLFK